MRKITVLILLALSSGCASRFLYYPDHRICQTPQQHGLKYEEITFSSSDGTPLTGWFVPATRKATGTVIHFHGNAQNITAQFYSYRTIVRDKIGEMPVVWIAKWPLSFLVIDNRRSPGAVIQNISPIPLLLVHGTSDHVVPYRHAQALFNKANEPKQLWTIIGADRTEAFASAGVCYRKRLVEFFAKAVQSGRELNRG